MLHEEIVTFEVAKLAKEKGFPQQIGDDAYIVENEYDDVYEVGSHYPIHFIPDYLPTVTAPTQSLLQRWLREEKNIDIVVMPIKPNGYAYILCGSIHEEDGAMLDRVPQPTYESALEDALKYALENLI